MESVKKFPAAVPSGGHIVGQPFTLSNLCMPVSASFACNCAQPPSEMTIVNSSPVTCPSCGRTYIVAFNPQNGQLTVAMSEPQIKVES